MTPTEFETVIVEAKGGRVYLVIPFDPSAVWGDKPRHHVRGTLNEEKIRGPIDLFDGGFGMTLGPTLRRSLCIAPGDRVRMALIPEGPQRGDLDPDLAAAFEAHPRAGAFFDGIAQFYRKAYLRWIDGAKRRPEVRAARIAELVALLEAGIKQRP